jgi:hypothetical protein
MLVSIATLAARNTAAAIRLTFTLRHAAGAWAGPLVPDGGDDRP